LVAKCKAYQQADKQIRELILTVEDHWLKIEDQMNCLREIWETLEGQLQVHYHTVFLVLKGKLQQSVDLVARIAGHSDGEASLIQLLRDRGRLSKGRFVWSGKECIEKAVKELDEWHRMFDPSWYMMRRISNRLIDRRLATFQAPVSSPVSVLKSMRDDKHNGFHSAGLSVFIDETFVSGKRKLPYSPVQVAHESSTGSCVVIDTLVCRPDMDTSAVISDVRDLARELTKTDPLSFNLLGCRGVIKNYRPMLTEGGEDTPILTFDFVFAVPQFLSGPRSLRELLLLRGKHPFLDEKIELAKQLANSVAFVHSANFVHKNIRPETILIFEREDLRTVAAFLVGFEVFRMADGRSYGHRDSSWEKNIYRHPHQQGFSFQEYYLMQDDIYTLGVCLLEIGLWQSFVICDKEDGIPQSGNGIDLSGALAIKEETKRALRIKELFIAAAQERLPIMVGSKYSNVVVSCLSCLDRDNQGFGDESEFQDSDGVVIGVKYIERVLLELQQIAV
jgi:serine/threonine protein kinase